MKIRTSDPTVEQVVRTVAAAHREQRGALLPILHAVQAELGHVPKEAVPVLADELNLSRADVHGVVSFYHDFRAEPAGRRTVRVCRAEACQAQGAGRLVEYVEQSGLALGQTAQDGSVTVEQVFCLGNCALGPAVEVDGRLHGRVDTERLGALLHGTDRTRRDGVGATHDGSEVPRS
ncbi:MULTISPECIES: formate dehydrogenase subunit gamma [unclassified Streptomyces]|uniref:Formate dehydrogenase subunit gamma n=1 Tax=Streptomyces sp. NBC_00119 TaxID=2975659 RepID=A0AAU1U1V6_9ACTN|nr:MULTISPECIES: formate dehydrogenase subunit gamma [unclassified Streptomyces]MCX4641707.1 formate dehydrogenase subunit gamma [Streptomyces sp. NBC_01446]MCX5321880.1 formate dehydrogenase subunit gamma [Streptomyces sp. NBC_00120]